MKIKIVSDGTPAGTKVVHADTGETVEGVQMINFMASVDGQCEALMSVVGVQCEIYTEARQQLVPDENPYMAYDLEDDDESPSN